ncbi:MAG: hypothetical protein OHK0039_05930 [Bacteroidia bacterium]
MLLGASALQAQKGLKVGAYALPQAVFLYNADDLALDNDVWQPELLWGMSGALVLGYNFNDYIGVRVDAIYSQQGGAYSVPRDFDNQTTYVTRLNYMKLPLLLGMNTNPARKYSFSLYGGVQLDLLASALDYTDYPVFQLPAAANISELPSTRDLYEPLTYSFVGEMGLDIRLPPENLVLNLHLRGDYGLVDAENKDATIRVTQNGTTTRQAYWPLVRGATRNADTFGLTAGLKIGLTYTFGPAL